MRLLADPHPPNIDVAEIIVGSPDLDNALVGLVGSGGHRGADHHGTQCDPAQDAPPETMVVMPVRVERLGFRSAGPEGQA